MHWQGPPIHLSDKLPIILGRIIRFLKNPLKISFYKIDDVPSKSFLIDTIRLKSCFTNPVRLMEKKTFT